MDPQLAPVGMAKLQRAHSMVKELFHSPAGTDTGYLLLVRTIGSSLDDSFSNDRRLSG